MDRETKAGRPERSLKMATEAEIELGKLEVVDGDTYRIKARFELFGGRENPVLRIGCRSASLREWRDHWVTIAYEEKVELIEGTGGDDMEDLFLAAEQAVRGEDVSELLLMARSTTDQLKVCSQCGKEGVYNPSKRWAGDFVRDDRGWIVCRNQPCK